MTAEPSTSNDRAAALREQLVRRVARTSNASPRTLDALRRVPRERFLLGVPLEDAYADSPYPIGHGQTISQPTVIAMMTEALELDPRCTVLEIGTGCGYQTAILATLARHVYSIEIVPALADAARDRLHALGIANVSLRVGDGYAGWPEAAPFDRIIATAAPPDLPQTLVDQLADGGILVAPIGPRFSQDLVRIQRRGEHLDRQNLGPVAFVPMVRAN